MKRTHYSVLRVLHNDSAETIRAAYQRVKKSHEAGLLAHDRAIIAEAKLAKEAFETLSDPARKAGYDSEMSLSTTVMVNAVEVKRVPFWSATRILVWSALAMLALLVFFLNPKKSAETNPATYVKKFAAELAPSSGSQPAKTPDAQN
jgi:hypothetical protein